jgi:hypothetical protein
MPHYGMHYILEDKSGMLTGSDFVDINDRLRLSFRCTAHDQTRTAYMIYDSRYGSGPLVALDFGSHNSLGVINFASSGRQLPMKNYLVKRSG